ncbi:hypothetical protein [Vulcanisaeta souniana]|uniref:hypothetical protein n=1 Tax=Vulcanisaeta souniana TaxID=164452 RepID=UPI0006D27CC5|nr:hypothetical protein [Vulcanisaeta souniana]
MGNASAVVGGLIARAQSLMPSARLWYVVGIIAKAVASAAVIALVAVFYVKRRELIGSIWLRARGGSNRVRGGGGPCSLGPSSSMRRWPPWPYPRYNTNCVPNCPINGEWLHPVLLCDWVPGTHGQAR